MQAEAEAKHQRPLLAGDAVELSPDGRPTLIGAACEECGGQMFPYAPVCCLCGGEKMRRETMSHQGTLYSFSVVHVAAKKWKKPMVVGYVDLLNGVRLFTHLDGAAFAIGDRVEVGLGTIGEDETGPIVNFVFRRSAP